VGRRIAERLAVELRQRLQDRFPTLVGGLPGQESEAEAGEGEGAAGLADEQREELQLTLATLGYEPLEIHRALRAVAGGLPEGAPCDDWIRESLRWLSRPAA
jgi:Holliday junction DNA helicase RuvA